MYYINKIVGFLVSPIGGAIAGGVIAVVCAPADFENMFMVNSTAFHEWVGIVGYGVFR